MGVRGKLGKPSKASFTFSFTHFMAKFRLKSAISLDGVIYQAGASVELTKDQAVELAECLDTTPTIEAPADEGDTAPKYGKLTKKQLVEELEKRGAEFDPNAKNADLVAILEAMDAAPQAPVEGGAPEGDTKNEGDTF